MAACPAAGAGSGRDDARATGGRLLVEPGREIALAEAGDDRDDQLVLALGPRGDLERRVKRGTGADADEDALLAAEHARVLRGLLVRDLDDLVVDLRVQDRRDESRAD